MFFIGDVHGRHDRIDWLLRNFSNPDGRKGKGLDQSLQVGDMGVFNTQDYEKISLNPDHRFFRGNHDNPELCLSHPNCIGDCGYFKSMEMFWVAGGYSIDYKSRTIGVSWWDNEELSSGNLSQAIEMYADLKPKIMVTHECPTVIQDITIANAMNFLPRGSINPTYKFTSRTGNALQAMFERHMPAIWIYGHWHYFLDTILDGVRFVGLGDHRRNILDQVFEIPNLSWQKGETPVLLKTS